MNVKLVCVCILVLSAQSVRGQNLTSPCPNVFVGFDNDGKVYGEIDLLKPNDEKPVPGLEVRINFTVAGPTLNKYHGNILPGTSNSIRKYNQGQSIKYRVLFPLTEVPPKVTALIVNGNTICQGPEDVLGEYTSSLSLRHNSRGPGVTSLNYSGSTRTNTPTNRRGQTVYSSTPRIDYRRNIPITTAECGLVAGGNQRTPLINNGLSYERGDIPWLVAIYRTATKDLTFICGGTLVSDRHIVTAAHCMSRRSTVTPIAEILVKVGVHRLNDWSDDITVNRKVMDAKIYEEYDSTTLQNDILVLTLAKRVTFNQFIRPACLWSGDTALSRVVGETGIVAGWGDRGELNTGIRPDEPQMARIPIVSTTQCRASKSVFHVLTFNNTLCAGDRNGVGPCTGDSGGGLYILEDGKWRLRGVVSVSLLNVGDRSCNLKEYVVFTDTAQFLPWIRNILSVKYYD